MEKNTRFVGDKLWNSLVQACKKLKYLPTDGFGASPQYRRLVFDNRYHLLTFEVSRGQFPTIPDGFYKNMDFQNCIAEHFNNVRLDVVDLYTTLYFNFWVCNVEQDQLADQDELIFA